MGVGDEEGDAVPGVPFIEAGRHRGGVAMWRSWRRLKRRLRLRGRNRPRGRGRREAVGGGWRRRGARSEDAGRLEAVGEASPRRLRAATRRRSGRRRRHCSGVGPTWQRAKALARARGAGPRRTRDWAAKRASRAGKGNGPTGFDPNTIGRFKIPFLI